MHNNMLNFGSAKMSKSLAMCARRVLLCRNNNAEIFKYMMLSAHYRSVLDFSPVQFDTSFPIWRELFALALATKMAEIKSDPSLPADLEKVFSEAKRVSRKVRRRFQTPPKLWPACLSDSRF